MLEIKRDLYLNKLINKKDNGQIKIITGIRRCGKSYLLFNLFYNYLLNNGVKKENIITLSLDDDLNKEYRNPDKLRDFIYSKILNNNEKYFVLLDEVQFAISNEELKSNEPLRIYGILNGLLHLNNVDVYITGSNSKFLSTDVMTEFRGRGDEIRVYPLSFKEFYSSNLFSDKYDAWDEYIRFGGLPNLLTIKTYEEKDEYLKNTLKNTYLKDVIERYNLRGNNIIETLVDVLASSIGSLTNPNKLANTFKSNNIETSDVTISLYIDYLIDAFIINKAKRYNIKGRKYINSPFKYYFTDIGIRNSKLNFNQIEPTHIMENIIYNELLIRGYNVDVGIVEHFTNIDGKQKVVQYEVDFVCNKYNEKCYIQSAFSIPDQDKMKQECSSLDKINDSYKKIIITMDRNKPWYNEKGYLILNMFDFLLNEDSLKL